MLASVITHDGEGCMYALQIFPGLVSMSAKQSSSLATLSRKRFTLSFPPAVTLVITLKSEPQRAGKPVDTYCTQRPSCTLVRNRRTYLDSEWIWTASSITNNKKYQWEEMACIYWTRRNMNTRNIEWENALSHKWKVRGSNPKAGQQVFLLPQISFNA